MREYLDMQRACLGVFAMAARRYQNEIAGILLARGITEIPNVLGAIPVRLWLAVEMTTAQIPARD